MSTFSFDIVSDYDRAEINNVFAATQKEIANRYDLKGTLAEIDWLDDKKGIKVVGSNEWQIESITDIIRKKLASRNQSSKVLDLTKTINISNMKATKDIPFVSGLDQEKAKKITKLLRDALPRLKTQIQGEAVRAISSSKDELQTATQIVKEANFDFPVAFTNYR